MAQKFRPYDPLDERQKRYEEIVALRAQGKTLQEIGDAFGLSRARVAQIIAKPPALAGMLGHLAKLHHAARADELAEAIEAMCRDCEPEGSCRAPACPLRAHSPLPLAVHEAGEVRTLGQIRADSWTSARREKAVARAKRYHEEGVFGTPRGFTDADRAKGIAARKAQAKAARESLTRRRRSA